MNNENQVKYNNNEDEILFGGNCYLPSTVTGIAVSDATWRDAEDICRSKAGHLVSIHNSNEQLLVQGLVSISKGSKDWDCLIQ